MYAMYTRLTHTNILVSRHCWAMCAIRTCIEQKFAGRSEFHCLCSSCRQKEGYMDDQMYRIRFQAAYMMPDACESHIR